MNDYFWIWRKIETKNKNIHKKQVTDGKEMNRYGTGKLDFLQRIFIIYLIHRQIYFFVKTRLAFALFYERIVYGEFLARS
jgi:hypothetical protein